MEIQYTNKQKKEITKAMKFISRDIMRLIHKAKISSLNFKMKFKNGHSYNGNDHKTQYFFKDNASWHIIYDGRLNRLCLYVAGEDPHYYDYIVLWKKSYLKKLRNSLWAVCLDFAINYPNIRQDLVSRIEEKSSETNAYNSWLDGYIKVAKGRLSNLKNAVIEFNFPETLDQEKIQIYKKNGQTIGTIDFSESSISIITDGNIVLVPRSEIAKQKIKTW